MLYDRHMTKRTNRWSSQDRQAFGDGNRLRAQTIQGKRADGPLPIEWDDTYYEVCPENDRETQAARLRAMGLDV